MDGQIFQQNCEFLLDYEIDEEEWGRKKKPLRYRWPDQVRDDVLARLMALNGSTRSRGAPCRSQVLIIKGG